MDACKACGEPAEGNFCSNCGHALITKRITFHSLVHDVFHLFTHLDKGFGYTLKQLIISPGTMQRHYVEGDRARHQKPFSMFFICATITALARYWIFNILLKYYDTGNVEEGNFFHEYLVLFHIALVPIYTMFVYLLFYRSGYNYAELGVMSLYAISLFFLITIVISLLKFIWPSMDTAYIELPLLVMYNLITFIRFFNKQPKWLVAIKSIVCVAGIFLLTQVLEDWAISML